MTPVLWKAGPDAVKKGGPARRDPRGPADAAAFTPPAVARDEVRGIDAAAAEELGLPTLVLMENAGRGAAALLRLAWSRIPAS